MEQVWLVLKFLIALEDLVVWVRSWIISQQQEADQAELQGFIDEYKGAKTDGDRLRAAQSIQASIRAKR